MISAFWESFHSIYATRNGESVHKRISGDLWVLLVLNARNSVAQTIPLGYFWKIWSLYFVGGKHRWSRYFMSNFKYEWVKLHMMHESYHIWMSHVTYECVKSLMNESCRIWCMSHVTYEWDARDILMRRRDSNMCIIHTCDNCDTRRIDCSSWYIWFTYVTHLRRVDSN